MLCSYYVVLPLTLLPSKIWHTLDALAHGGPQRPAEWDSSLAHLAQPLKHLPGSMSVLQTLVSSCTAAARVHVEVQASKVYG